jgi:hypothetical protein
MDHECFVRFGAVLFLFRRWRMVLGMKRSGRMMRNLLSLEVDDRRYRSHTKDADRRADGNGFEKRYLSFTFERPYVCKISVHSIDSCWILTSSAGEMRCGREIDADVGV